MKFNARTDKDKLIDNQIDEILLADKINREDIEKLYKLTSNSIYSFALSILKNSIDAEDVLQESFIIFYTKNHLYHSQGKPLAWMLMITKNLCIQKIRENKKTLQLDDKNRLNLYFESSSDTLIEDKMIIEECLNNLSDEEAQIIVLHAVSGLKHREIAKILNLPLSTILSKYNRSIKKLKKFYERMEK